MTRRIHASFLLLLAATVAGFAQVATQRPVVNFRLPVFNDQGYRIWELRGGSGRFVDKNHVELTAVRLQILSGDESNTVEWEITSPLATARPDDKIVSGPGQLRVVGRNFELFGDDWTYAHDTKTVVIRKNVVATFSGSIGNILQ